MKNFLKNCKRKMYFVGANYFGFFARLVLVRSRPTIITVTGTSGKTTLLHMFEAQFGNDALISHKANSAFGIPFHILGLERKTFSWMEWPMLILMAPFKMFRILPKQIYVTEADAERPGEGRFLARLLRPDYLVWLSLEEAHGVNYDSIIDPEQYSFENLKRAIAREFGEFFRYTKKVAVLNIDNPYIAVEAGNHLIDTIHISNIDIQETTMARNSVNFKTYIGDMTIPALVPRVAGMSALAVSSVMSLLQRPFDNTFATFTLPPGRSSVFEGKIQMTLIDSTYNATFDGMRAMLELFAEYPAAGAGKKWLVLGDMIEEGMSEAYEHEELARMILKVGAARVILVGPRLQKYTAPKIPGAISFLYPDEVITYLERELSGDETILFKGARFLEGIVEEMLKNPADAEKLCRREDIWKKRRATFRSKVPSTE